MMELSKDQLASLWVEGSPVAEQRIRLLARPGTGKTHTLARYSIDLAKNLVRKSYQGIALLSYTNVASREMHARIVASGEFSGLEDEPNYIGTFDAFINQKIVLPYGHRYMKCSDRPRLVAEPYSSWETGLGSGAGNRCHPMYFDCFTLDVNDEPRKTKIVKVVNGQRRALPANTEKIKAMKTYVFSLGYATQADANHIAYKILKENSDIRTKIVNSFPVIIIDEAQDLTETQHAIIDLLTSGNSPVKTCVLVGDPAQAIYEWNTARPDLLLAKTTFSKKEISKTYRCSPSISRLLSALTPEYSSLEPVGKNRLYMDNIEVRETTLSASDIKKTYQEFLQTIKTRSPHDGHALKVCLLARSKDLMTKVKSVVNNSPLPTFANTIVFQESFTLSFIEVAYLAKNNHLFKAGQSFEKFWGFANKLHAHEDIQQSVAGNIFKMHVFDAADYRKKLMRLMHKLAIDLKDSIYVSDLSKANFLNSELAEIDKVKLVVADCEQYISRSGGDTELSSLHFPKFIEPHVEVIDGVEIEVFIGTVHSVKGETYDGVLYFSKDKAAHSMRIKHERGGTWDKILEHETSACEEKRVVYVALSRAAQCLWICAESKTANYFQEKIKILREH